MNAGSVLHSHATCSHNQYRPISDIHAKFHQHWVKTVEVSQLHLFREVVGLLGWFKFYHQLLSEVDYH